MFIMFRETKSSKIKGLRTLKNTKLQFKKHQITVLPPYFDFKKTPNYSRRRIIEKIYKKHQITVGKIACIYKNFLKAFV